MAADTSKTRRGFTGHEQVDRVGIIHMNGRIYDAKLGRFLQADPMVEDAKDSQGLNRYSYVLNNPLSLTDPSGYLASQRIRKGSLLFCVETLSGIRPGKRMLWVNL
jgi:RHS repeat-associated protein